MRITHYWNENRATIRVEGLTTPVKALMAADLHIGLIDERDPERNEKFAGLAERFHARHDNVDADGSIIPQETAFVHMLDLAGREEVDVLALVGDLVDFPAIASVEYAARLIDDTGIPAVYTPGNHDWLFYDQEATTEVRRRFWPRLDALTGGEPACSSRQVGDLLFVTIDNSIYQVEEEQLEFARDALGAGLPTVLLSHIPISLPTLREPVINEMGTPILMADPDWALESRQESFVGENTATTLEFVRLVGATENLVAILTGHVHFRHVDAVNPWAVQYIAPPGYAGEYWLFEWQPL